MGKRVGDASVDVVAATPGFPSGCCVFITQYVCNTRGTQGEFVVWFQRGAVEHTMVNGT